MKECIIKKDKDPSKLPECHEHNLDVFLTQEERQLYNEATSFFESKGILALLLRQRQGIA